MKVQAVELKLCKPAQLSERKFSFQTKDGFMNFGRITVCLDVHTSANLSQYHDVRIGTVEEALVTMQEICEMRRDFTAEVCGEIIIGNDSSQSPRFFLVASSLEIVNVD